MSLTITYIYVQNNKSFVICHIVYKVFKLLRYYSFNDYLIDKQVIFRLQ